MTINTYSVAKVDYRGAAAPKNGIILLFFLCHFLLCMNENCTVYIKQWRSDSKAYVYIIRNIIPNQNFFNFSNHKNIYKY